MDSRLIVSRKFLGGSHRFSHETNVSYLQLGDNLRTATFRVATYGVEKSASAATSTRDYETGNVLDGEICAEFTPG